MCIRDRAPAAPICMDLKARTWVARGLQTGFRETPRKPVCNPLPTQVRAFRSMQMGAAGARRAQTGLLRATSTHSLSHARSRSPEEGIDGSRLTQSVITAEQMMSFSSNGLSELFQLELIGVGLSYGHAEC